MKWLFTAISGVLILVMLLSGLECDRRPLPEFNFGFESEEELDALKWQCRTALCLSDSFAATGQKSLKVVFHPAKVSFVAFDHFQRDWSAFNTLRFFIFNKSDKQIPLQLYIEDNKYSLSYMNRYNHILELFPGANHFTILFDSLRTSDGKRVLNSRNIHDLVLCLRRLDRPLTLYFDDFRLE